MAGRSTRPRTGERRERRSRSGEGYVSKRAARHLEGVKEINPTDYEFLRKFLTEHGKIMPSRLTGANAKQQRQIKRAVRRARVMGLLP